jgi:hypothetical protein
MDQLERLAEGRVAGGVGREVFPAERQRPDELGYLRCRF